MSAQLRESNVEHLRVPPQSIEAEQNVLGGLMLAACGGIESQERAWANVADLVTVEDFYRRDHQQIFRAISERQGAQIPFDPIVLGDWFASQASAELVAGGTYLVELCNGVASSANIRAYADIVRKMSIFRQLIEVGSGIVGDGFQPDGRSPDDVVASAAARVIALTQRNTSDGLRPIHRAVDEAWNALIARDSGELPKGMPLPWQNLQAKIPGLDDTDLLILAARPSMGKTAAAMEIADDAASGGRNVAVFSLEMSAAQLTTRLISRRARVDAQLLRSPRDMTSEQWEAVNRARSEVRVLPIAIDDSAGLNIDALCARATRMHAKVKGGLGLIVIDYLQLIEGTGKEDRRHDEVARISRRLKQLAKDLRCPVIALSQLNRSLESRNDKRPIMADLRESGAIEQDADIIVFIYRDDYYTKDACGAPGISEFIIGKQRNGPTGVAYLEHHLECSYFDDYHGPKPNYQLKAAKSDSADGFDVPKRKPRAGAKDAAAGES